MDEKQVAEPFKMATMNPDKRVYGWRKHLNG